ncbi:hypothetical protein D3C76_62170 [compost metagenome]
MFVYDEPNDVTIDYLTKGTSVQKNVYELLQQHGLMEKLAHYKPILVGTVPLDIQIEDSDLDIICEVDDFDDFETLIRAEFQHYEKFSVIQRDVEGVHRIKANFQCEDWPIEIFGQGIPVLQQNGYRHMRVEARMLRLFGKDFKCRVHELKQTGCKTEPAFASILGLQGDPYKALLIYEDYTDDQLAALYDLSKQKGR